MATLDDNSVTIYSMQGGNNEVFLYFPLTITLIIPFLSFFKDHSKHKESIFVAKNVFTKATT